MTHGIKGIFLVHAAVNKKTSVSCLSFPPLARSVYIYILTDGFQRHGLMASVSASMSGEKRNE